MGERLSRFGVGPQIAATIVAYMVVAWAASYEFPNVCLVPTLDHPAFAMFAWVLIAIGVVMWLTGIISVMRAYNRDELIASGVFGIVRHPVYAAWIVLILPGLALFSTSWPLLLTPLVGYAVFKRSIHREGEYLAKRFGRGYLDYRGHVNEIIPIPRRRRN
jgi:protein-S-isoprenylcysteine O-methyltransferase Ste14